MDGKDPNAVDIMVTSTDPEKEEDLTPKHDKGKQRQDEKEEPEIVSVPLRYSARLSTALHHC